MSTAPLKSVAKARKPQGKCRSCNVELPAGSPYRYYRPGFRGVKVRICMKAECTPTRSQMSSGKMADVYAAQEDAEREAIAATDFDALLSALETLIQAVEETKGEYEDTISETPMTEENLQPFVDELEQYLDELNGVDFQEYADDANATDGVNNEAYENALNSAREIVAEAIGAI